MNKYVHVDDERVDIELRVFLNILCELVWKFTALCNGDILKSDLSDWKICLVLTTTICWLLRPVIDLGVPHPCHVPGPPRHRHAQARPILPFGALCLGQARPGTPIRSYCVGTLCLGVPGRALCPLLILVCLCLVCPVPRFIFWRHARARHRHAQVNHWLRQLCL